VERRLEEPVVGKGALIYSVPSSGLCHLQVWYRLFSNSM
jgi:hypothetical protein